jgi:RNA polymerase sigma factor (sigma-70 family)
MDVSDQQLLHDWSSRRDAHAFQAIVQRHAAMVFHTALRILKNRSDAEDATQTCFETLATAKEPGKIQSLAAWLHGTATNRAHNLIRTDSRRTKREHRYAEESSATEESNDWQDIYPLIDEAIQSLDEIYRLPIIAHFLEGQSHSSIGQELNVGRSTITTRIQKGVRRVESMLKEKGVVAGVGLASLMTTQLANATVVNPSLISSLGKLALGQGEGLAVAQFTSGVLGKISAAVVIVTVGITAALWLRTNSVSPSDLVPRVANEIANVETVPTSTLEDVATESMKTTPAALDANPDETSSAIEKVYLTGYVVDAFRNPVPGSNVHVQWHTGNDDTVTNEEGAFRFPIPEEEFKEGNFVFTRHFDNQGIVVDMSMKGVVDGDKLTGTIKSPLGQAPVTGKRIGVGEGLPGTWKTVITYNGEEIAGVLTIEKDGDGIVAGTWEDRMGISNIKNIELPESITLEAEFEQMRAESTEYKLSSAGRNDIQLVLLAPAMVSGRAIDSNRTPLTDWTVRVRGVDTDWAESVDVDNTGAFTVSGIPSGDYTIYAGRASARAHLTDAITLRPGDHIAGLEIVFELGHPLSGTVVDYDGAPIEGVRVTSFFESRNPDEKSRKGFSGTTDANGRYEIDGIPDESDLGMRISVLKIDYLPQRRQFDFFDGTEQDFTLFKTPRIEGQVLDATTRRPIDPFRIRYWQGGPEDAKGYAESHVRRPLISETEGRFSLLVRGYENICVVVSAPGYATGFHYYDDVQPGEAFRSAEVLLHPVAPIKGSIVDTEGNPVANARIYLGYPGMVAGDQAHLSQAQPAFAHSGAKGRFRITEYPKSVSIISAYKSGYAPAWADLPSHAAHAEIVLARGTELKGIVTYNENSAKFLYVNLVKERTTLMAHYLDDNGRFVMKDVPHGSLTLTANFNVKNGMTVLERDIFVTQGNQPEQNFHLEDSHNSYVEGKISVDGQPKSGWIVAVVQLDNGDRVTYNSQSFSDGTYRLGPVPAAAIEIGAHRFNGALDPDLAPVYEMVTTEPGETTRHDINVVTH